MGLGLSQVGLGDKALEREEIMCDKDFFTNVNKTVKMSAWFGRRARRLLDSFRMPKSERND